MRSVFLVILVWAAFGSAKRCSIVVAPMLQMGVTSSGLRNVTAQETLSSLTSRVNSFLDGHNVSFADSRQEWLKVPTSDLGNTTVLSGWVQSQNRFGMCALKTVSTGTFSQDMANQMEVYDWMCDSDPNVIGFLQTISMVWLRSIDYVASDCDWNNGYLAQTIIWEPRTRYVAGSGNGFPLVTDSSTAAQPIMPNWVSLPFLLATVTITLSL